MKIKIKALANLRHYFEDKSEEQYIEIEQGAKVRALLKKLNIPEPEIMKIAINNKIVNLDYEIKVNDEIIIFPILSGG